MQSLIMKTNSEVVIDEDLANVATKDDCWLKCQGIQLYAKDKLVLQSPTAWIIILM